MSTSGFAGYDPICGMWLAGDRIAVTYAYLGRTYTFCCKECRDLFVQAPEAHIVRLAHEPGTSAGHRCPHQAVTSEREPPRE